MVVQEFICKICISALKGNAVAPFLFRTACTTNKLPKY